MYLEYSLKKRYVFLFPDGINFFCEEGPFCFQNDPTVFLDNLGVVEHAVGRIYAEFLLISLLGKPIIAHLLILAFIIKLKYANLIL